MKLINVIVTVLSLGCALWHALEGDWFTASMFALLVGIGLILTDAGKHINY